MCSESVQNALPALERRAPLSRVGRFALPQPTVLSTFVATNTNSAKHRLNVANPTASTPVPIKGTMSKLSDYSKFDHLDSSEEEEEEIHQQQQPEQPRAQAHPNGPLSASKNPSPTGIMRKNEQNGRYVFEFHGQAIYEWEQTLEDVTIYVKPPPAVEKGNQIRCQILPSHLQLGLQGGTQWFLSEPTGGLVDVSESTWSLEEDDANGRQKLICIYLIKAHKGEQWNTALAGTHSTTTLDPVAKEQVKKELMLERFQEENPGFDFRGADFNGAVPDPRVFMGGVKYS
jgi:hypothetical protein